MAKKKWTVVVIIDGETLKATGDGTEEGTVFEGNEDHIATAKFWMRRKSVVSLGSESRSPDAVAGYKSPLALTAGLFSVVGPYTLLWSAPKEVTDFIQDYYNTEPKRKAFTFEIDDTPLDKE